jgi:formate--tetrahydrofolate ligase
MHGGVKKEDLKEENVDAVIEGCKNLAKHISNIEQFGVPVTVAINEFYTDTKDEHQAIIDFCKNLNVVCKISSHWKNGGTGASELAAHISDLVDSTKSTFKTLYEDDMSLWEKTRHITRTIYGADDIIADQRVRNKFVQLEKEGFGNYPICMAKTQYSFSTDPLLMGAPTGHEVPIREVRLCSGAEFIVVVCGAIMTMPGLPRKPASEAIGVDKDKNIKGLF